MQSRYDTNLAAEFFCLSAFHRLGMGATLTLSNRKAVDIVIVHEAGDAITVDVKGLAGTTSWPVDKVKARPNHFLVFVCFLAKFDDPSALPEVYVVPSRRLDALTYHSPRGRKVVQLSNHAPARREVWRRLALAPGLNRRL
jgi:hypothetical protein